MPTIDHKRINGGRFGAVTVAAPKWWYAERGMDATIRSGGEVLGSAGFGLRDAVEGDKEFLIWLRKMTMSEYLLSAGIVLSDAEHMDRVNSHYDSASIVLLDGQSAGLLKAYRKDKEWIIVQVQISPDHQGKGLGSKAVSHILTRAAQDGLGVSLSVFKRNPAKRLYERLGFKVVGESGGEFLMTWKPGEPSRRDSTAPCAF